MGFLKEKYIREYFTNLDEKGRKLHYGATGAEKWCKGGICVNNRKVLSPHNFKGCVVLDMGYGKGEALCYILKMGAKKVVGCDFFEAAHEVIG